ncbi:hypothetical protein HZC07_03910 [Candidatus Micrarchaeota archaeon]|nr:hypothetical protein [Candidatus Micrarchaeota archaeon]
MFSVDKVMNDLTSIGITEQDAQVITDCIITRKSCSWVNTDNVDETVILNLKEVVAKNDYKISVKVQSIPSRNKYIWEVKVH